MSPAVLRLTATLLHADEVIKYRIMVRPLPVKTAMPLDGQVPSTSDDDFVRRANRQEWARLTQWSITATVSQSQGKSPGAGDHGKSAEEKIGHRGCGSSPAKLCVIAPQKEMQARGYCQAFE
jgi:hypothetical protein